MEHEVVPGCWRAPTDRDGLVQPDSVPFSAGGYRFCAVVQHRVRVA